MRSVLVSRQLYCSGSFRSSLYTNMAPTDPSQARRRRHSKYVHVDENAGLEPNMPDKVSGYVANIISAGLAEGARPTGATRVKLLENARALVYALETPREALARYSWAEVCLVSFSSSLKDSSDYCFV